MSIAAYVCSFGRRFDYTKILSFLHYSYKIHPHHSLLEKNHPSNHPKRRFILKNLSGTLIMPCWAGWAGRQQTQNLASRFMWDSSTASIFFIFFRIPVFHFGMSSATKLMTLRCWLSKVPPKQPNPGLILTASFLSTSRTSNILLVHLSDVGSIPRMDRHMREWLKMWEVAGC